MKETKWQELIKASVVVVTLVLSFTFIIEGVYAQFELEPASNPLHSIELVDQNVNTYPMLTWNNSSYPMDNFDVYQGTQQLYSWLHAQILDADIEQYHIDVSPIDLEYIDFFAGEEVGDLRYGAYRLLEQAAMFKLSPTEYENEMVYLFEDLPLTIQGKQNEVTLETTDEVIAWKTEVLTQQSFSLRLQQYYAKRRFEDRTVISSGISPMVMVLRLEPTFTGWIRVYGKLGIHGCSSIPFGHHVYTNGVPIEVPMPIWMTEPQCVEQYKQSGFTAFDRITIEYTEDDGFLNPRTQRWFLDDACRLEATQLERKCLKSR